MEADETFQQAFPPVDVIIPPGVKLRPVRTRDPDAKPLGRPPKKQRFAEGGLEVADSAEVSEEKNVQPRLKEATDSAKTQSVDLFADVDVEGSVLSAEVPLSL